MSVLKDIKPIGVFKYFEEISNIPRGSGNMKKISEYCIEFAKNNSLEYSVDDSNNVIIFKNATHSYENCSPVILQSHLDMVCQKDDEIDIDFEKDGVRIYVDGDFIKAKGTTLGADNGIGVAVMLAILADKDIKHPPIEAIFTTDEEIGMIGAANISLDCIQGKRMINLDSGEMDTVTVSCAGGSDFKIFIPIEHEKARGTKIAFSVNGLKGGHSGVEINSGAVNADKLTGRILYELKKVTNFSIICINGGNKGNAIPVSCTVEILTNEKEAFISELEKCTEIIKNEILERESGFNLDVTGVCEGEFCVLKDCCAEKIINTLILLPNGVQEMSSTIENLVETSLNLGIVKSCNDIVEFLVTLRSNKKTSLEFLEEKLKTLAKVLGFSYETSGHYPPWEFNSSSQLLGIFTKAYEKEFGKLPEVQAIHAGLECGMFSSKIDGFDAISIGPDAFAVHTTKEKLSISSVEKFYALLLKVLANLN